MKKLTSLDSLKRSISQKADPDFRTLDSFSGHSVDEETANEWFSSSGHYAEWTKEGSLVFVEGDTEKTSWPF